MPASCTTKDDKYIPGLGEPPNASGIKKDLRPAFLMTRPDHLLTKSHGNKNIDKEYNDNHKALVTSCEKLDGLSGFMRPFINDEKDVQRIPGVGDKNDAWKRKARQHVDSLTDS